MGSGLTLGTLSYLLDLDADPFDRAMKRSESTAQRTGSAMTKGLTLPLAAVGIAAGKMALDFESTFSQMQGLAGVSADEIDGLKDSVLGLAGETAKSPQELAEALYFIRSAGIGGQQALDALEASAKGAAAGLGSTVDVADAVTSAMNAYAAEGLSAAAATDALVAAAEIGKVEAAQLAPQLGRLAGTAASLDIGFESLAGTVAFLSRTNGDASLSATQMAGALAKILSPGRAGKETLDEIGLSLTELRKVAGRDGVPAALELLRKRLADAGLEFSDFAEDQQFIQAALALTGDNFAAASEAIDQAEDSAGKTDEAFSKFAETMGFKNKQAAAEMQSAMIALGDILIPLAADVAGFATAVANWFSGLPDSAQTGVVAFGILLAAAGPLIAVGSNVKRVLDAVPSALDRISERSPLAGGGLSKVATGLRGITRAGLVVGIITAVGTALDSAFDKDHAGNVTEIENALARLAAGDALSDLDLDIDGIRGAFDRLGNADGPDRFLAKIVTFGGLFRESLDPVDKAKEKIDGLDKALASLATRDPVMAASALDQVARAMGISVEELKPKLDNYNNTLTATDTAAVTAEGAIEGVTGEVVDQQKAVGELVDAIDLLLDQYFSVADAQDAFQSGLNEIPEMLKGAAVEGLNLATALTDTSDGAIALREHMRGIVEDGAGVIQNMIEQGASTEEVRRKQTELGQAFRDQAEAAKVPEPIIRAYLDVLLSIPTEVPTTVSVETAGAMFALDAVRGAIAAINGTPVNPGYKAPTSYARSTGKWYDTPKKRAMGGPVWAGQTFLVEEEGPEMIPFPTLRKAAA